MDNLIINTDGGARGNPGPAAIGAVIKTESGRVLKNLARKIGQTTNNVAEYTAVIEALSWVKENIKDRKTEIKFLLDSTLVVNQLNGLFKVKDGNLRNLFLQARILAQETGCKITYSYVPREKNSEADFLVNQALDNPQ